MKWKAWTFDKSTGICWLQDMDDPTLKQVSPLCDSGVVLSVSCNRLPLLLKSSLTFGAVQDHFDVTASVQIQVDV